MRDPGNEVVALLVYEREIGYAEQQTVPGMLLFIDIEKAFDTLELKCLEKISSFPKFWRLLNYLD